jgi:hypothetical protein
MKISRNAPCPCGSGQKYKKCCLPKEEARDFSYRRISQTYQSLTGKLMNFAENSLGPEAMEEAIDHFLLWGEELDTMEAIEDLSPVMLPWILFSWYLMDFEIQELDFDIPLPADTTVAELYARKRPNKIDDLEFHILESVDRLVFSFHEVTSVSPGSGFACTDILTGNTHRVTDHGASEYLRQGDVFFCAISRIDDVDLLAPASPVTFPLSWKTHVIDLRASLTGKRDSLTLEDLPNFEIEIRTLFLKLYASSINPPALTNTDGEPLVPQTLHYDIVNAQQAFDALCHLCVTESPEELLENADLAENGALAGVTIPWSRQEEGTAMSNTILGYIDIAAESMIIDVNSEERAETIRGIIANAMGDRAQYRTTTFGPQDGHDEDGDDDEQATEHARMMQDPAIREYVENMFLEHWGQWIDTPIPALDGQTPRQAMSTPVGREKVEALIGSAELNSDENLALQKKGIARARKELGM